MIEDWHKSGRWRYTKTMNTNVTAADGTTVIGYYFWCSLSKAYMAVKATGERRTAQKPFQAVAFIEG
jgi:hypothetical protein